MVELSHYTVQFSESDRNFIRIMIGNWVALAISSSSKEYPGLYRDSKRGDLLEVIGVDVL